MDEFNIQTKHIESKDAVVIRPDGSIDSTTTPMLESCLKELIAKQHYNIVLDLSNTDFISSSGFGVFFGCISTLRDKGGDLVLMNIPKSIADVLEILNIKDYFKIITKLEDLDHARA